MNFKIVFAIAAGLLLAGCYESQTNLLNPAAARQPIASNSGWTDTRSDSTYHNRLSIRSDGWYDFSEAEIGQDGKEGDWETHTVLLNDLGSRNGWALYAFASWDTSEKAYVYGIVGVGNGTWRSAQPSCDTTADSPPEVGIAVQAGARHDNDKGICVFSDSASLLTALRNYSETDGFWKKLNRQN